MSKALSVDLRERVVAAIAAGASCRGAAARFGVSAASAIRWWALEREQGDARPKALGGDRRSGRISLRYPHLLTASSTVSAVSEINVEAAQLRQLFELVH